MHGLKVLVDLPRIITTHATTIFQMTHFGTAMVHPGRFLLLPLQVLPQTLREGATILQNLFSQETMRFQDIRHNSEEKQWQWILFQHNL